MSNQLIVTCGDCSQKNRLPFTLAVGKAVVCGRCKAPLDYDEDQDDEDEDDEDLP